MYSHFEGSFSEAEKTRIERAARAADRALDTGAVAKPSWAFLHFEVTYNGYPYWGVRRKDGFMIRAQTTEGLVQALETLCKERRQRRRVAQAAALG